MAQVNTYASAAEYLGKKSERPGVRHEKATRIHRIDDHTIAVRYHATDVVTYRSDGTIVLDSGGWRTPTTKVRMGDYAKVNVYQSKSVWYFHTPGAPWPERGEEGPEFYDGMIVNELGEIVSEIHRSLASIHRRIDRQVSAYIKGFVAAIEAGEVEKPSGGDCWGCYMQAKDAAPGPHGRAEPMGYSHYMDHFAEGYYVPSLLMNALKARGYGDLVLYLVWERRESYHAKNALRQFFARLKPALYAMADAKAEAAQSVT